MYIESSFCVVLAGMLRVLEVSREATRNLTTVLHGKSNAFEDPIGKV